MSALRDRTWWIVATREMSVKVRDRGFLVSTGITLLLILGVLGFQVFMGTSAREVTVATVGDEPRQVLEVSTGLAEASGEDVRFAPRPVGSAAEVRALVLDDEAEVGLLAAGEGGWELVGASERDSDAEIWIGAAVRQTVMERNAAAAGTSMAELAAGGEVSYELLEPGRPTGMTLYFTTFVFTFLFYFSSLLLGSGLATSVVEEKQNRIVEIVASSIRVRDLLIGKTLGATLMALAQIALLAGVAVVALLVTGRQQLLEQISAGLGWYLVFYTVGVAVLACVFAAAGAVSTRHEDIASTTTPVSTVLMVMMFASLLASGTLKTVLSFLPLGSVMVMPSRLVSGDAAWWEAAAALLISLAAAAVVIRLAERIYRRALMQTSGKLTFRQALRLTD
ncbi:ABC transporter permease [Streptomyces sp. UH6]|uniref:ABC transporter permease n=1 Tax=Streptomyces sp. UH6 TaxID=2748379 RepID=UPI0015D48F62|nr:ABC transporter permease [Streptomyces sp. UH6]NYV75547.1 ABC transporter permease [Streptomyces sp. UH6]